jgi:Tol biopolymer transport system component/predicted Ser/Thr protein kinase
MSLDIGTKLGPYEILTPIDEGGMGEVYRARDTRLDRVVAVKVSKDQFSERFEHEARAVAALNHPHICQLYDVGPNYLVMEFVEGTPLKGPLPLNKAVEYAGQILDALDAAHRKGIVHRDLKPGNILVTKQGIKLLDFGLAKQSGQLKETDGTLTAALTGQGQILGTLQYMSPEQLHGKEADARSDLFSFGCVLYEMLTGQRAFEGQSAASVIAAILEREPAPLDVSPPLERVIQTCLKKDPDQRFQNALDLKRALAWALERQPIVKTYRPWWIAAATALALSAGGGWAASHFLQPSREEHVVRLQIDPPENGRFIFGFDGGIDLSPDGTTAAYIASVNGKTGLWVRPLNGTAAHMLPGTEGATTPFWSPDNRSIAFFAGGKLQRADLEGGVPTTICDVQQSGVNAGGAWSSDGRILIGGITLGLSQVSLLSGKVSILTTADASEFAHRWPRMLPGGRFIYYAQGNKAESSGVYAASLAKPADRVRLASTDSNALFVPDVDRKAYLLWLRGGTLAAQQFDANTLRLIGDLNLIAGPLGSSSGGLMNVVVSRTGLLLYGPSSALTQHTWFDRTGKQLGAVEEPDEYSMFRLSPDGRHIAAVRGKDVTELWMTEVVRGTSSRFTFSRDSSGSPIWSPDGQTIVFASGSPQNLFRKQANGAGSEQRITQGPNIQLPMDWSGDGRWILYAEVTPSTQRDLWILPVLPDGRLPNNAEPRPYLRTPANEIGGRFSPEPSPRWVAYQSDETGRYEIYIRTFPKPQGKFQISTNGGRYAQWGAGGRELFYVSPTNRLMVVTLKLGRDSVEPSTPRELFPMASVDSYFFRPYDTAPDGQRFLVLTPQQSSQPLTVIVNWPALLKGGATAQ